MTAPKVPTGHEDYSIRPRIGNAGCDAGKAVVKVSFQHEQVIDAMLARPRIMTKELAEMFGYSAGWLGRVINSDSFQARLAERKEALTDPGLSRRLNARLQGVTIQAVEVLSRKLESSDSASFALEALGISTGVLAKGNPK